MTSDKDQGSYSQPNYADHLKRVRRVKRTLDVGFSDVPFNPANPPLTQPSNQATNQPINQFSNQPTNQATNQPANQATNQPASQPSSNELLGQLFNQPPKQPHSEREHVSHESTKDQADSRKTRRPAEDYEVGKVLSGAELRAVSHPPAPAEPQAVSHPPTPAEPHAISHPPTPAEPQAVSYPPTPAEPHRASPSVPPVTPQLAVSKPPSVPESVPVAPPAAQTISKPPAESQSKDQLGSADKPNNVAAKTNFGDGAGGKRRGRPTQFVAKTLLDHNAILKAQALRQKARVEQEISLRQQQPVKIIEPIKAQKQVRSCPFSWTEDSTSERFKHCAKCQSTIYNFNGLEFSEAENLIFKRENRKRFVLFMRPDGKFMTSDCPFEKKRKQQIVGIVAICICVIACIAGAIILMPPPPPPTASNPWSEPAPTAVSSESTSTGSKSTSSQSKSSQSTTSQSTGTTSSGTVQHYEAGEISPTEPDAGLKVNIPNSGNNPVNNYGNNPVNNYGNNPVNNYYGNNNNSGNNPVPPSEEAGDFWEFPEAK